MIASSHDALVCTSELLEANQQMARSATVSLLAEFWAFLRVRKKWWLAPIFVVLLLFAALMIFAQGSALAPFIYTVF
jgi:hypothetical protein